MIAAPGWGEGGVVEGQSHGTAVSLHTLPQQPAVGIRWRAQQRHLGFPLTRGHRVPAHANERVFMFAGSLLVGLAVIMVAVWLEYHDSLAAGAAAQERRYRRASDVDEQELEVRYQKIRRRWRLVIHLLLALCGGLMIAAGWAGPGRFWIAAWTAVALLMLCIVMLAAGDALRTHHHRGKKLPKLPRQP